MRWLVFKIRFTGIFSYIPHAIVHFYSLVIRSIFLSFLTSSSPIISFPLSSSFLFPHFPISFPASSSWFLSFPNIIIIFSSHSPIRWSIFSIFLSSPFPFFYTFLSSHELFRYESFAYDNKSTSLFGKFLPVNFMKNAPSIGVYFHLLSAACQLCNIVCQR